MMKCRIGITHDPETRKIYWESEHSTFKNWKLVAGPFKTKSAAQIRENELLDKSTCEGHPGGSGPENAAWYVYRFEF